MVQLLNQSITPTLSCSYPTTFSGWFMLMAHCSSFHKKIFINKDIKNPSSAELELEYEDSVSVLLAVNINKNHQNR